MDPVGTYNGHYKKKMVKMHITADYEHNIPLAKKVCGGTEDDYQHLEEMLNKTAVSAKKNILETWFDGVLDIYHMRNHSEGINSYMKNNVGLETHVNGKGMKNIDLHTTQCCITLLTE